MANILIVDDDKLLCDGLALRIADTGHQVLCSYTLTDAQGDTSSATLTLNVETNVYYGTSGVGTLNHLVMEQFKHASGVPSMAVPYRSIGQAFTDAAGGQIQVIFPGLAAAMPHVRSGAFKPLAVTGARRHPLLPDVPTFKESGFDGFEGVTWYGIVGPAGLPQAIVRKLNDEVNKSLASTDLRESFAAQAIDTMPMTPARFGQYIADEITHWTAVARASKIEAD